MKQSKKLFTIILFFLVLIQTTLYAQSPPAMGSMSYYGLLSGQNLTSSGAVCISGRVGAINSITGNAYATDGIYAGNTRYGIADCCLLEPCFCLTIKYNL